MHARTAAHATCPKRHPQVVHRLSTALERRGRDRGERRLAPRSLRASASRGAV